MNRELVSLLPVPQPQSLWLLRLPRPLGDPLLVIRIILGVSVFVALGFTIFDLLLRTGESHRVYERFFLLAYLALIWSILPRQRVGVIYLRAFRNDHRSGPIRSAAQLALGKEVRLSGIRDPRRRRSYFFRYVLNTVFLLDYSTPKYMNLEAGRDWRARLWRTFADVHGVLVDLTEITDIVVEEIVMAHAALGLHRILFIGNTTSDLTEWRTLVRRLLPVGAARDEIDIAVAIWSPQREARLEFQRVVRDFGKALPARGPGVSYRDGTPFVGDLSLPPYQKTWNAAWLAWVAGLVLGWVAGLVFRAADRLLEINFPGQGLVVVLLLIFVIVVLGYMVKASAMYVANSVWLTYRIRGVFLLLGSLSPFLAFSLGLLGAFVDWPARFERAVEQSALNALAQIVVWLNAAANALGTLALAPLAMLPEWFSATVVAAATGLLMLLIFKHTSNQQAIKRVRNALKADLLTLKLFKESASVALGAQGRIFLGAARLLGLAIVPMLVMVVPMWLISLRYESRPLRAGEEAVMTLKLNGNAQSSWPDVHLQPADALEIDIGPIRVFSKREICWNIKARERGYHRLIFHVDGQPAEKELAIGDGFMRVSTERPAWSWSDALLNPWERPFRPESPVQSIEIVYPERSSWTSGTDYWLAYYFVVSLVAAFCLRKPLGVNI